MSAGRFSVTHTGGNTAEHKQKKKEAAFTAVIAAEAVIVHPADRIFLSDILNALDNNILANTYDSDEQQPGGIRSSVNNCLWSNLNSYMRRFTERMTLADLIKDYKDSSGKNKDYMYYI